ncbi:RHS domain-containing protein [Chitinivorax sp. B]|nr:RHS domain-containing protein [Chitinivorax sp. B]
MAGRPRGGPVQSSQLYYFHTDQIGTPREVTDQAG